MPHFCHAFQCKKEVPPRMLMCAPHWRMVPARVQKQVWAHYRPGQEVDKNPSEAYLTVQRTAVWLVAVSEGKCGIEDVPMIGSADFKRGPRALGKIRAEKDQGNLF